MLRTSFAGSALRSGFVPAALTYVSAALLLRHYGPVSAAHIAVFTAYVALCLSLPGTLVWRLVDRRSGGPRPFIEDVVLGTALGYVMELPAYLLWRSIGLPHLVVTVPALVVVASLLVPRARRVCWRRARAAMPATWSWSTAALVLFAVAYLALFVWSAYPMTPASLARPYIDEPFHLAMVGELRHHFPAQMPFVEGTPLFYHWLTYAHLASSSWVTGLEPVLLLRTLSMLTLVVLTVLGVAVVTSRLGGVAWAGPVVSGLLVLCSPLDVFGWTPAADPWTRWLFLNERLALSPTQTFGYLLFLLLLLLCVETMRGDPTSVPRWVLVGVLFLVVAGTKSTFVPIVLAGLVGTIVMGAVLRQRRSSVALLVIGVIALLLAQKVFYGPGTRSLELSPLALPRKLAQATPGLAPGGQTPGMVLAVVVASYVLAYLALGAGVLGLLPGGGWRRPVPQFVVAAFAAALGALLLLDHPGKGQVYFLLSGLPVLLVGSGLGLAELARRRVSRRAVLVLGAVGGALGILVGALTRSSPTRAGSASEAALRSLLLPQALAAIGVLAVVAAVVALRRRHNLPVSATLAAVSVVLGLGLVRGAAVAVDMTDGAPARPSREQLIPSGGINAARWLRAHSRPDDLVATNAHCTYDISARCDRRNFWMSGYAERRMLVEGWAYVAPETVGAPSTALTNSPVAPFWNSSRLRDNDAAFRDPSPTNLRRLRDEYHVRWLLVDRHYPVDVALLRANADVVHRSGQMLVVRLD